MFSSNQLTFSSRSLAVTKRYSHYIDFIRNAFLKYTIFNKPIACTFILSFIFFKSFAVDLVGCYIGGGSTGQPYRIYYQKIGTTPAYSGLDYTVFSSSTSFAYIVNTDPNNLNKCDNINNTYNSQHITFDYNT